MLSGVRVGVFSRKELKEHGTRDVVKQELDWIYASLASKTGTSFASSLVSYPLYEFRFS